MILKIQELSGAICSNIFDIFTSTKIIFMGLSTTISESAELTGRMSVFLRCYT